jgi:hypothetical protein
MLLHLNFCIEWFGSNSKEKFKTYLKFLGKNWKKKKKTISISFLAFSPSAQRWPSLRARPHPPPTALPA